MKQNDMKSVVYLILALVCFYYLLDDFYGKNKISNWVSNFIGNFGGIAIPEKTSNDSNSGGGGATETATSTATNTAPSQNLAPNPLPLIPEKAPNQPNTKPAKTPANPSWNPFPNLSFPNIFGFPAALPEITAGGIAALTQLPRKFGQLVGG